MNDILQALMAAANKIYPMRGVRDCNMYLIGSFILNQRTYAFMIEGNKGTFGNSYINQHWFDVVKDARGKVVLITFNGVIYKLQQLTLF
jgi:hypothetical protein